MWALDWKRRGSWWHSYGDIATTSPCKHGAGAQQAAEVCRRAGNTLRQRTKPATAPKADAAAHVEHCNAYTDRAAMPGVRLRESLPASPCCKPGNTRSETLRWTATLEPTQPTFCTHTARIEPSAACPHGKAESAAAMRTSMLQGCKQVEAALLQGCKQAEATLFVKPQTYNKRPQCEMWHRQQHQQLATHDCRFPVIKLSKTCFTSSPATAARL